MATGIEEHNRYGLDFIEASGWIKQNLPHALISGGISNVSFSFRGNNPVREAIHSVFLYSCDSRRPDHGHRQCRPAGVYDDLPEELRHVVEDVVLFRTLRGTDALLAIAENIAVTALSRLRGRSELARCRVNRRLEHALVKGITAYIDEDTEEAEQRPNARCM